ncbi:MAG: hypothetical protein M1820_002735 [Bogoriella megaspora]|nr:MAG: hypothetical protein M1820_002735 [Bogoriella megaspora]
MSELVHVLHRPFLPSGTSTESMAMDPQHISPDAGPPHSYNNDDEFTVDRRRDPSPRLTSLIAPIPGSGTSVAAHYSPSQAPYSPAISSDDDFYLEVVDPMETPMILAASPIEQNDMVSASSPVQSSGSQGDSIPDPLLGISSSGPSIIEQDAAGKFERLSPGPLAKNGHYPRERYHEMPGYWWYHTKEEIDNMTRPEFRGRCFAIG